MGTRLLEKLLLFFAGDDVWVSTRRPETVPAQWTGEEGVRAFFDNRKIFRECHAVVLCFSPSQCQSVMRDASEVRDEGEMDSPRACFCMVPGLTLNRLHHSLPRRFGALATPSLAMIDWIMTESEDGSVPPRCVEMEVFLLEWIRTLRDCFSQFNRSQGHCHADLKEEEEDPDAKNRERDTLMCLLFGKDGPVIDFQDYFEELLSVSFTRKLASLEDGELKKAEEAMVDQFLSHLLLFHSSYSEDERPPLSSRCSPSRH